MADGCNTLVWTLRQSPYHDIDTPDTGVDTDIPRLRAGGVGAQFWSLLVPPGGPREPRRPTRWCPTPSNRSTPGSP